MQVVKDWYNESYGKFGIKAQRRYPNEELCRFMGRNFFDVDMPMEKRKKTKILELGCGSCANLWMIAKEGFDAYGCDLSENAIIIGKEVLDKWKVTASLTVCNMIQTPYPDNYFDVALDVGASVCLGKDDYHHFTREVGRILKPSGLFFSYFFSKKSDAFLRSKESDRVDEDTVKTHDEKSPCYGNEYPLRFMSINDVNNMLPDSEFTVKSIEAHGRTYRNREEYFEYLVIEAVSIK